MIDWDEKSNAEQAPGSELSDFAFNRKHFGSAVLERVVPSADGNAEYNLSPGHVTYRLSFSSL